MKMIIDQFEYAELNGGIHFFQFSTGNTLFRVNLVQIIKLVSLGGIWYLDYFAYAEFNGDVHFYCFRQVSR